MNKKKIKKTIHKSSSQYPVVVCEDELGGYWVECPVLEGCYSQGETINEALENIQEAISLCLEDMSKSKRTKQSQCQVSLHLVKV